MSGNAKTRRNSRFSGIKEKAERFYCNCGIKLRELLDDLDRFLEKRLKRKSYHLFKKIRKNLRRYSLPEPASPSGITPRTLPVYDARVGVEVALSVNGVYVERVLKSGGNLQADIKLTNYSTTALNVTPLLFTNRSGITETVNVVNNVLNPQQSKTFTFHLRISDNLRAPPKTFF